MTNEQPAYEVRVYYTDETSTTKMYQKSYDTDDIKKFELVDGTFLVEVDLKPKTKKALFVQKIKRFLNRKTKNNSEENVTLPHLTYALGEPLTEHMLASFSGKPVSEKSKELFDRSFVFLGADNLVHTLEKNRKIIPVEPLSLQKFSEESLKNYMNSFCKLAWEIVRTAMLKNWQKEFEDNLEQK